MANIKFSQFTQKTTLGTVDFLVGYTGAQNIQIDPVDLLSGYSQGTGAAGQVTFFNAASTVTGDNNLYWDNTNKRLGIGTATPGNKLEVQVTSNGHGVLFKSNATQIGSILRTAIGGTVSMTVDGAGTRPININNSSSSNVLIANGGGNVGIGTTSPVAKLQVEGSFISSGISQLGTTGANVLLTSSSAGNVGIGTSGPVEKLQINSGDVLINNSTVSSLKSGGSLYIDLNTFGSYNGRNFRILNNGTSLVNVKQTGEVGIGTTSPTAKLHIQSSDNAATANLIYLENIGSGGSEGVSIKFNPMFNAESMIASNREGAVANACNLTFHTYDNTINEAMRITSAGKVGIGTTTPAGIFEVFEQGTGRTTGDLLVDATSKYVYVGRLSTTSGDVCSFKVRDRLDRAYFDVNTASKYISFNPEIGNITMTLAQGYGLGVGTTSPEQRLHVASVSDQYIAKFSHSIATGYAPGSILLEASQGDSRGQGIFHYNTVADDSWFTGVPYNVSSTKWIVSHKPDTTFNPDVAQLSHAILTIDSSNNNVGIGTSSPGVPLDVFGSDGIRATTNSGALTDGYFAQMKSDFGANALRLISRKGDVFRASNYGQDVSILTGNPTSERIRVTSTGNVGIGTTSPSAKLTVANGDVEVTLNTKGIILKSPDGTRYRITVANGGTLTSTAI